MSSGSQAIKAEGLSSPSRGGGGSNTFFRAAAEDAHRARPPPPGIEDSIQGWMSALGDGGAEATKAAIGIMAAVEQGHAQLLFLADGAPVTGACTAFDLSSICSAEGPSTIVLKADFPAGREGLARVTKVYAETLFHRAKESKKKSPEKAAEKSKGIFFVVPRDAVVDPYGQVEDEVELKEKMPKLADAYDEWRRSKKAAEGEPRFSKPSEEDMRLFRSKAGAAPVERASTPPPFAQASPESEADPPQRRRAGDDPEVAALKLMVATLTAALQGGKGFSKDVEEEAEKEKEKQKKAEREALLLRATNEDATSLGALKILAAGPGAPRTSYPESAEQVRDISRYARVTLTPRAGKLPDAVAAPILAQEMLAASEEINREMLQRIVYGPPSAYEDNQFVGTALLTTVHAKAPGTVYASKLSVKAQRSWEPADLCLCKFLPTSREKYDDYLQKASLALQEAEKQHGLSDKHQNTLEKVVDPEREIRDMTELLRAMEHMTCFVWAVWGPLNFSAQHMLACREKVIENLADLNDASHVFDGIIEEISDQFVALARHMLREAQLGRAARLTESVLYAFENCVDKILQRDLSRAKPKKGLEPSGPPVNANAFSFYRTGPPTFTHSPGWLRAGKGNLNHINVPFFKQLADLFPPEVAADTGRMKQFCVPHILGVCTHDKQGSNPVASCGQGGGLRHHKKFDPDVIANVVKQFEENPFVVAK